MRKEIITSRQNPSVREVCALVEKKARRRAGLFRFDGVKLLREAILCGADIVSVYLRDPVQEAVSALVEDALRQGQLQESALVYVSEAVFEKISEEKAPEGVITVARLLEQVHRTADAGELVAKPGERVLLAESLRDPGNLGTVMRSCAALGIDRLILSEDCADLYNPKTVRSAMGALFRLPTVTVSNEAFPQMIMALRHSGRRVFAAALRDDAEQIGAIVLRPGDCFVIGNEGHGLRAETIDACDSAAIIPMREGNESLNAAAAAAICIWETVRAEKS